MSGLKDRLRKAVDDAKALNVEISTKAEAENRLLNDDEQKQLDDAVAIARRLKAQVAGEDALSELADGMFTEDVDEKGERVGESTQAKSRQADSGAKSIGQQFVESKAFTESRESGLFKGQNWSTPTVEAKTTLTGGSGSGEALYHQPTVIPGILPLLYQPLTVADLMPNGQTSSSVIRYLKETTFTNAADTVSEGGTKPESALVFDEVDENVRKIAHWIPVTDEMLEDVDGLRSYIDGRLELGVKIAEEDQLLNGAAASPPDIVGILNRTGLAATQARGSDSNVDAIFKEIVKIETSAFLPVDAVVINPANWQNVQLMKDGNGNYIGSGPFAQAQGPTLWGRRVVVTSAIASGTGLVGAFRTAAQIFRRGGLTVSATNSHSDYFVKNLTAIRAEERLALAVYRPGAFGKVTGLA